MDSDEIMPSLRNCRIYGSGVVFQELSDFPRECTLRAVQISHGNTPQIMCLSILSLATQSQRALGEFFRNDFDSLLFFSAPGVCLWLADHTSKQAAGVLATEAASAMFLYCCPSSSRKNQRCSSSQRQGKLLTAFLLKATSASNEK